MSLQEPPGSEVTLTPGAAARELGVSPSSLRRLAVLYEVQHGPLPRDPHGGRRWPLSAVRRAAELHALRDAGVNVAELVRRPPRELAPQPAPDNAELVLALRALTDELRAQREGRGNRPDAASLFGTFRAWVRRLTSKPGAD